MNEIQKRYLQKADPSVQQAISNPKAFKEQGRSLNPRQAIAAADGIRNVIDLLKRQKRIVNDLTPEEIEMINGTRAILVKSGGKKVSSSFKKLANEDPKRLREILRLATESIAIKIELDNRGINRSGYLIKD